MSKLLKYNRGGVEPLLIVICHDPSKLKDVNEAVLGFYLLYLLYDRLFYAITFIILQDLYKS